MIQKARGTNSRSLLREIEYCVLVLDDEEKEQYFHKLFKDIIEKRNDPKLTYTGAKAARQQLLVALSQLGDIATANIWARHIIVDLEHINELRSDLEKLLRAENIYGVLEVHLQDREILSPHIQFVGTKAEQAELIIAQYLVEKKYELSIEAAIGHSNIPKPYEYDNNARTEILSDRLKFEEELEEAERIKDEIREEQGESKYYSQMSKAREEFLSVLNTFSDEILEGIIEKKDLPKGSVFAEVQETISNTKHKKDRIREREKIYAMPNDEFDNFVDQIQSKAKARRQR